MDSARKNELINIGPIILVPAILLLHNFNYYKSLLFYKDIYLLFLFYLTFPVLFYLLVKKFFNYSPTIATLLTLCLSICFFYFGAIQDFLLGYSWTHYFSKTYILPFILLLPVPYLVIKKPKATRFLKFLSVTILFFFLSEAGLFFLKLKNFNEVPRLKESVSLNSNDKISVDSLNIYHIIFDGYTNSKTLKKEFGFNNPIDSFLKEKRFFVADKTKSNYNFTPYSITSTLNLQYLDVSGKQLERNYKNYFLGNELYHNNAVFIFFKEKGYTIQLFSLLDNYDHLDKLGTFVPKTPAFSIRNQTLERIFLNPWLWQKLKGIKGNGLPNDVKESLQYYADYNEKAFANVLATTTTQRVFNFTHFSLPHEPYVYTKAEVDSLTQNDVMDHQQGYVKQVQYANSLIEKLVTELQTNKNNIIIIQGDHGFREYDALKSSPLQQFETLNAIYFPDQDYRSLYDSISLVNTYRVVLNQYFHQDLPLLKDKYFIPTK
jgi:hypothetical protein